MDMVKRSFAVSLLHLVGPRVLGAVTAVGMVCLGSTAWASSVAGSPASDGTGNSNALPSHPHSVMDSGACGCAVSRGASPSASHASVGHASSHAGASMRTSHSSHSSGSGRSSSFAHFARPTRSR